MIKPMRKWNNIERGTQSGFTLIELLVYAAVFSVSAVFLVNILTAVTQTQVRQTSGNEVNQQISFVSQTIQNLVQQASLIENDAGVASSTLTLRMASSSIDPTIIYTYASGTAVYLEQGTSSPVMLTNDKVTVNNFSVTKFENPGSLAVVQVNLTLAYNTLSSQSKFSKSWWGAVTPASAATFDSSILPNSDSAYDIGGSSAKWNNGYFANNVQILGGIGLGTTPSLSAKLKSTGDIGFSSSAAGVILMSPGGTCFRLGISNAGTFTTSTATCP